MNATATATPRAFLGMAEAFRPQLVARVCMDCSDRAAAEALARECAPDGMTHGLCDQCAALRLAGLLELPPIAAAYGNKPAFPPAARTADAPAVI
jgi:hypothetical protein